MKPESRTPLIIGGLIAASVIYCYPLFLPTPLLEPDEGLHATISQEMLEHDEWIVPTFRGEVFMDKPILYFWAQMVSLQLFGMQEFAVRLPGLMFGLFGSITAGLLATRLFDSRIGLLAWLMSMTMLIPLALAQAAVHDVAVVPFTNLALLCLWETERSVTRTRRYQWLVFAAGMFGLAILTKALIGVALIGVGYGLFLIFSRTISFANCFRLGVAITVGSILASPWFIAMEIRNPGYLNYYFIERHLMGFATATQRHGQYAWYYYLPYMTLGSMPWIWYIAPLLRDEWKQRSNASTIRPQLMLLLCWLFGGLLFLSMAKSKLVTYSLPLFPAMAILCAVAWERYAVGRLSDVSARWFQKMLRFGGTIGIIVPFAVLVVCGLILGNAWSPAAWLLAAAISLGAFITWLTFERKRFHHAAGMLSVWVAGMACLALTWPLQVFAEEHSERSLAKWINRQPALPENLILVGEKPASVLFYLSKKSRQKLGPKRITSCRLSDISSRRRMPPGVVLAVTIKKVAEATSAKQRLPGELTESVGQFHLFRDNRELQWLAWMAARSNQ